MPELLVKNCACAGRPDFLAIGTERRDAGTLPRIVIVSHDTREHEFIVHEAGDEWLRRVHAFEFAQNDELTNGLEPCEALRVGVDFRKSVTDARRKQTAGEEKARG